MITKRAQFYSFFYTFCKCCLYHIRVKRVFQSVSLAELMCCKVTNSNFYQTLSVNDVYQIWIYLTPSPPYVTQQGCFTYTQCQERANPPPPNCVTSFLNMPLPMNCKGLGLTARMIFYQSFNFFRLVRLGMFKNNSNNCKIG